MTTEEIAAAMKQIGAGFQQMIDSIPAKMDEMTRAINDFESRYVKAYRDALKDQRERERNEHRDT